MTDMVLLDHTSKIQPHSILQNNSQHREWRIRDNLPCVANSVSTAKRSVSEGFAVTAPVVRRQQIFIRCAHSRRTSQKVRTQTRLSTQEPSAAPGNSVSGTELLPPCLICPISLHEPVLLMRHVRKHDPCPGREGSAPQGRTSITSSKSPVSLPQTPPTWGRSY